MLTLNTNGEGSKCRDRMLWVTEKYYAKLYASKIKINKHQQIHVVFQTTNGIMLQNEKLVKASSKNGIVTDPFKDAEEFHYK